MKYLIRLLIIIFLSFDLYAQNVSSEEKIVINLDSEEQIQKSMEEIRSVNHEDFKTLDQLRAAKSPQFKSKLYSNLYALRLKQKMDALIPKRELGYYEKIKESDKRVEYLISLYLKITKPEEKVQWEKRLKEAAEQRFLVEVEMKQSQIAMLEKRILEEKKSLSDFETQKERYISRFISKTKAHLKK